MSVVYKLWEHSWAENAARCDRTAGPIADPAMVRRIEHHGAHFHVDAIHLCEPSPQRTPVLFQARSSSKGRHFAARHAECLFVSGPSAQVIAPRVAAIRAAAKQAGCGRDAIKAFSMMTVVIGSTEAEAEAKLATLREWADPRGGLVLMSGKATPERPEWDRLCCASALRDTSLLQRR